MTVRVVEDGSDEFDEDASSTELHAALGADHKWCGDRVEGGNYGCITDTVRVYASPEQDGDLVYNRLNDIVADGECRVRVAQSMIFDSRLKLVDLLVKLKQGGCEVYVVGSNIQDQALAKLKGGKIPVRKNITHDKTILVDAKFADSPDNRRLVFTGSHNWTQSANYRNDELFVRVEDQQVHDAFLMHFNAAYNTGTPL